MLSWPEKRLGKWLVFYIFRLADQAMTLRTIAIYSGALSPFIRSITLRLSPFSCETETNPNKAKADNHVPCADTRDWVGGLAYVENDDPEEADQEVSDHNWSQPAWALKRSMWLSVKYLLFVSVLFLNFLT